MALEDIIVLTSRPGLEILQGVVSTAAMAPNPPNYPFWYCGVKINGSPNETPGLRYLHGYTPFINDVVVLAWFGSDGFVLGRLE